MPVQAPKTRPRLPTADVEKLVDAAGLDRTKYPFYIVGIRGYYRDTMGVQGANDSGIYDDAIFLVSPYGFGSFNANTDPSRRRPGYGYDEKTRGMARLQPGVWPVYRFAKHEGKTTSYEAICQRGGEVDVMRDGNPDYPHRGKFGINIHKGSLTSTSSEGCQTIYPPQWNAFIAQATDLAKRHFGANWRTTNVPYVLVEGQG